MLTCGDAGPLLDAFVDAELDTPTLLEVARHAGQCGECDRQVRELLALRGVVVDEIDRIAGALDLSRVWPAVHAEIARGDAQAAWRTRVASRRRFPVRLSLWGSAAAIAAGATLFFRTPVVQQANDAVQPAAAVRVAAKRLPNHVYIDRLAGKDIALRREPKSGTTIIWVNHEAEGTGW